MCEKAEARRQGSTDARKKTSVNAMNGNNSGHAHEERLKRVLILASKLGYQTRGFAEAAKKLGVEVRFGTDRCHQLDDPWGDAALALHFERPRDAAQEIAEAFSGGAASENAIDAVIALGDRPTVTAAYAAEALGIAGSSPAAAEICNPDRKSTRLNSSHRL